MTAPTARRHSLVRRVSAIIVVTLLGFMGIYAGIATVIEGRRFDAAAEKDLLLLDAVITAARERLSDAYQLGDPSFVRERLRTLAAEIPGVVVARAYDPQGRLVASLNPIGPSDPIHVAPGATPQRGVTHVGEEDVAWLARPIHLRAALGGEGPLLGYVLLGTSQRKNAEARWTATAVFIAVGAVTLGAMVAAVQLVVNRQLLRPIRIFSDRSRLVARGDLTQKFTAHERNEIGRLGEALNAMIADLGSMIRRVRETAGEVDRAASQIVSSTAIVLSDSRSQQEFLRTAEGAAQGIGRLLRDAISNIHALATTTEDVSHAAVELQAATRDIARAADHLAESVRDVTNAAAEEVDSIRLVNLAVGQLSAFVNETADLSSQMDETLRHVESTVRESLDLSLSVAERALRGREAMDRSKAGMDQIRVAFNVTGEGIERLRGHSVQVSEVVQVIDGVTKQVNLLALNASMIAVQAGEHGKRFSVVASEIRDLAERTSVSASKIAGLVERFQADLEYCVESMRSGRDAVENGQALAEESMAVLSGILTSSHQSASIVQAITDATQRHVAEGKRISELMSEVRERVSRINRLTTEQTEESRRILESARHMGAATRDVKRAATEQSKGSLLIDQTVEKARGITQQASGIATEQDRVMAQLAEMMRLFQELTERNLRSAQAMSGAIEGLKSRASALTDEVEKFGL